MTSEAPFFIVGCGRSGTTMLRRLLDKHSQLCVPEETHFFPGMHKPFIRRWARGHYHSAVTLLNELPITRRWQVSITAEELPAVDGDQAYASALRRIMQQKAEKHGKYRWGDKTPIYVEAIPLLNRLFSDARFIHIYRDGRDVALSVMPLKWGPNNAYTAGLWWKRTIRAWWSAKPLLGERWLEVSYEAFVRAPEAHLEHICAFLGVSYEQEMLDQSRIYTDRSGQWRNAFHMSRKERMLFELAAGDTLLQMEYDRSTDSSKGYYALRMLALCDELYQQARNRVLRE